MADCVDCSCRKVVFDKDLCNNLQDLNDSKVKGASNVLKDTKLCDYPKVFPKALYSIWCMFKNLIGALCSIIHKINELIDKVNAMCKILSCLMEQVKKQSEARMAEAFNKVRFDMFSKDSSNASAGTYTKVETHNDGTFKIKWNEVNGTEVGVGYVNGKVNYSYTIDEKSGAIISNIIGVTLNSIEYATKGGTGGGNSASYTILDKDGNQIYRKDYNPYSSFSENINKTITYPNTTKVLSPNGGTSGEITLLRTLDTWVANPTQGFISGKFTNNNDKLTPVDCGNLDCTEISKLEA